MPFYQHAKCLPRQFRLVLSSFMQHGDLPFKDALREETIQQAFNDEGCAFAQDDDVYTPEVTLWAFLSQVLFKGELRSCLAAVSRVVVLVVSLGRPACAKNSGAYCRARMKIPTPVIRRLATQMADRTERKVPRQWQWCGR